MLVFLPLSVVLVGVVGWVGLVALVGVAGGLGWVGLAKPNEQILRQWHCWFVQT